MPTKKKATKKSTAKSTAKKPRQKATGKKASAKRAPRRSPAKKAKATKKTAAPETQDIPIISWEARRFVKHERSGCWYFWLALIIIGAIIYGFHSGIWSISLAFAAIGAFYFVMHNEEPDIIPVVISALGIYVEGDFYPYRNLKSFWILYEPPEATVLYLVKTGRIRQEVKIQLEDADPILVREFLRKKVVEERDREESLLDWIERSCKL